MRNHEKTFKKLVDYFPFLVHLLAVMKHKSALLTLAIGLPLLALSHLVAETGAATSETRVYKVIKTEEGQTKLLNEDGTALNDEQVDWVNGACATNFGTAIVLDRTKVTFMTVRQDYDSFGWHAGGDVTFN